MKLYRIFGMTRSGRSSLMYVRADTKVEAEDVALAVPMDEGGFSSWSCDEIDELPDDALMLCEKCGHKQDNPVVVKKASKE